MPDASDNARSISISLSRSLSLSLVVVLLLFLFRFLSRLLAGLRLDSSGWGFDPLSYVLRWICILYLLSSLFSLSLSHSRARNRVSRPAARWLLVRARAPAYNRNLRIVLARNYVVQPPSCVLVSPPPPPPPPSPCWAR